MFVCVALTHIVACIVYFTITCVVLWVRIWISPQIIPPALFSPKPSLPDEAPLPLFYIPYDLRRPTAHTPYRVRVNMVQVQATVLPIRPQRT